MNLFQLIVIIISGLIAAVSLLKWSRRRNWAPAVWAGLWILAAIVVGYPQIANSIAEFLGIGRGADVVFYAAILAGLLGFLWIAERFYRMNRQITLLTRELALLAAEKDCQLQNDGNE